MGRKVQIEILAGPNVGESRDFEVETILVGRGTQCAMQLASPHVSRQQCELSWQGDQLVLENLGTVNVTYLNDRPIERVYVQDGDLITFCDVALRVRIMRAVDAPKTAVFGGREPGRPAAPPPPPQPAAAPAYPPPGPVAAPTQPLPARPSAAPAPRGAEPTMMNSGAPSSAPPPGAFPGPFSGAPPGPAAPAAPPPSAASLAAAGYGSMIGAPVVNAPRSAPLPVPSPPMAPAQMAGPVHTAPPSMPVPPAAASQWGSSGSPATTVAPPQPIANAPGPMPYGAPPPGPMAPGFPGGSGTGQHGAVRPGQRSPQMPQGGPPAAGMPSMAGMASIPGLGNIRPASPTPLGPGGRSPGGEVTAPPGPAPFDAAAGSVRKPKGEKRRAAEQAARLRQIRNIVLVAMGLVLLICVSYLVATPKKTKKRSGSTSVAAAKEAAEKGTGSVTATPAVPAAAAVVIDRGARSDDELLTEGERLYNIGATYLREYRFDDGNLDLSISYFEKSRGHFALVDAARWPQVANEIDARVQEARGLLDQEFRKAKINYVREKQSGRYDQAMSELERILRLFPDKDDERHQFAKKQQSDLRSLMAGGKKNDGPF